MSCHVNRRQCQIVILVVIGAIADGACDRELRPAHHGQGRQLPAGLHRHSYRAPAAAMRRILWPAPSRAILGSPSISGAAGRLFVALWC